MIWFMNEEDAQRHRDQHAVLAHELKAFLDGLDEEQLRMMGIVMDNLSSHSEPGAMASYFAGRITTLMEVKFNKCSACGKDHEKDLHDIASGGTVEKPPHVDIRRKIQDGIYEVGEFTKIGSSDDLADIEKHLMEEYNLDDLRDAETMSLLGFACLGCGMMYQSIQDRMLEAKGVEGCTGCIQKAKFG